MYTMNTVWHKLLPLSPFEHPPAAKSIAEATSKIFIERVHAATTRQFFGHVLGSVSGMAQLFVQSGFYFVEFLVSPKSQQVENPNKTCTACACVCGIPKKRPTRHTPQG